MGYSLSNESPQNPFFLWKTRFKLQVCNSVAPCATGQNKTLQFGARRVMSFQSIILISCSKDLRPKITPNVPRFITHNLFSYFFLAPFKAIRNTNRQWMTVFVIWLERGHGEKKFLLLEDASGFLITKKDSNNGCHFKDLNRLLHA